MIHNVVLRVSFQKELEYGNEIRNKTLERKLSLEQEREPYNKIDSYSHAAILVEACFLVPKSLGLFTSVFPLISSKTSCLSWLTL